ncbi:MAG: HAMP domain-containing sensor histidine kinase [Elusimicrobiota bacterium]
MNYKFNIFLIIGTYILVISLEYFRVIKTYPVSLADIYNSGISTFFIGLNAIAIMVITNFYSKMIVRELKSKLEDEQFLKDKMSKEMSRLESSAQLGFLVTRIAHDIRGPLASIKGYAQLAGSAPGLDDELKNDLLTVEHEVDRVVGLIEKMQRFIKPGTGQRNYVSLIEILEVVTTVICLDERMRRIKLTKKYPKEDIRIFSNAEELQQVFFNLLKNALEALVESAREGGEIQVKVTTDESWIITAIKDSGIGMSPETKQKIFTNFFTTKKNGTGLGMGIISDIVYGHGGKIELNSESGKGTEILVFLPNLNNGKEH